MELLNKMKFKNGDLVIITPNQLTIFGEIQFKGFISGKVNSNDGVIRYKIRILNNNHSSYYGDDVIYRESEIEIDKQYYRDKRLKKLLDD